MKAGYAMRLASEADSGRSANTNREAADPVRSVAQRMAIPAEWVIL